GTTLKDHVSAETYARIQQLLTALGLETNAYDTFKPWAVYLDLINYQAAVAGYQGGLGIDMYYLSRAQAANKSILELETYLLQFNMFDSYSKELQEQQLKEVLDSIYGVNVTSDTQEPALDVLIDLWVSGDDAGLEELISAMKESP